MAVKRKTVENSNCESNCDRTATFIQIIWFQCTNLKKKKSVRLEVNAQNFYKLAWILWITSREVHSFLSAGP